MLCPQTDTAGAQVTASNVLAEIGGTPFRIAGDITASLRVAQWIPGESAAALIERADQALYEAKRAGCNRVVLSS